MVGLALLTVAFFAPAGGNDFVMFDDDINIYNNPILGELSWERAHWAFTDHFYMPRYMPLGWLGLMFIFQIGGLDPAAYHWVNILMHGANAALVAVLVTRGLQLVARARGLDTDSRWLQVLGLGAALAWAVHPLKVEPVSWATSIHYVHATFWALIAITLTWSRLERTGNARRWRLWGAWVAYTLSVLVYPVTLGLPGALFLFEAWLRSRRPATDTSSDKSETSWGRLIREHAPFVGIGALALLANICMRLRVPGIFTVVPDLEVFSLWQRILQASEAAVYHLVRPWLAGNPSPVYNAMYSDGRTTGTQLTSLAVILILSATLIWKGRRMPGFAAWLAGCITVGVSYYGLLESPFQNSDRYTYFTSLIPVFGAAAIMLAVRPGKARVWLMVTAAAWWSWQAAAIPQTMLVWRDSQHLFTRVAEELRHPDTAAFYTGKAIVQQARAGHLPEARADLEALRKTGVSSHLIDRIGSNLDTVDAEARAPQRLPTARGWVVPDAGVSHNYALIANRSGEAWTARMRFEHALRLDPEFHDARYNFALWLGARGEADAARTHYDFLARSCPDMDPALSRTLIDVIERTAKMTEARTE